MPLFGGRDKDDDGDQQAAAQPSAAPEQGPHAGAYESGSLAGIPASGRERIQRMKQDAARGFFTSDLSRQRVPARQGVRL